MNGGEDTKPSGCSAEEGPFFCEAVDPSGNEFYIRARRDSGVALPAFIGRSSRPFPAGGVLGLVNRGLVRLQRPRVIESGEVSILVLRQLGNDRADLALSDKAVNMADARRKCLAIAHEIEEGTFRPQHQ